jgi:tRNA/rRNA methyltransferase
LHIPSDETYPALNLAQAVAICLYELRRAWLRRVESRGTAPEFLRPAPFEQQERAYAHLREALEAIHFVYGPKGDALMHAVRHLLGRARLTEMEVDLLFGLARQMRWIAEQARRTEEE